jgi:hypothetical protein
VVLAVRRAVLAQFPAYGKFVLGGGESSVTLLATFTVGIGVGSMLCERMSGKHVEIGLVPFGSIGLTLFGLDLYFASPTGLAGAARTARPARHAGSLARAVRPADARHVRRFLHRADVCTGPVAQLAGAPGAHHRRQQHPQCAVHGGRRAGAAALLGEGCRSGPVRPGALLNAAVALYIYGLVPEFLLRFIAWLLVKAVYRLRTSGLAHIPHEGAAVLVANHVSFADAVIIMGASPRRSAS